MHNVRLDIWFKHSLFCAWDLYRIHLCMYFLYDKTMPMGCISYFLYHLTKCFIKLSPFWFFFLLPSMKLKIYPQWMSPFSYRAWITIFSNLSSLPVLFYRFSFFFFFFCCELDAQSNPLYHAWNYVTDYKFYFYFRLLFLMWNFFQFKKIN